MKHSYILAMLLLAVAAPPATAQRHEATLEGSVFRGAIGYARQVAPRSLLGAEVGFGFPQIDRTLTPATNPETGGPKFEEFLHVAAFLRHQPTTSFEVDTGLRASMADLWTCTVSDCWPAPFAGAYVQPMVGGWRIKVGARLTAGWIGESAEGGPRSGTFTAGLTPFIIRATLPW
jgi:hypothetical protein